MAGLAGLLILIGAIAAGVSERAREAAILKVLGGSHRQILIAYLVEYGLVGAIAGGAGGALGAAGAWPVVTLAFKAAWSVDWAGVVLLLAGPTSLAALGGAVAALHALSQRPAPVLRNPYIRGAAREETTPEAEILAARETTLAVLAARAASAAACPGKVARAVATGPGHPETGATPCPSSTPLSTGY